MNFSFLRDLLSGSDAALCQDMQSSFGMPLSKSQVAREYRASHTSASAQPGTCLVSLASSSSAASVGAVATRWIAPVAAAALATLARTKARPPAQNSGSNNCACSAVIESRLHATCSTKAVQPSAPAWSTMAPVQATSTHGTTRPCAFRILRAWMRYPVLRRRPTEMSGSSTTNA